mgnify:CR=1 FL=1
MKVKCGHMSKILTRLISLMLVIVLAIIIIPDAYSFDPDMQDSSGTTKNWFYTKYSYSDIFIDYNNEELEGESSDSSSNILTQTESGMRLAESMFNLFGYSKKLRAYWNNRNAADDWAWCANTVSTAGYDANIEFLKKFGSRAVTDLMLAATRHPELAQIYYIKTNRSNTGGELNVAKAAGFDVSKTIPFTKDVGFKTGDIFVQKSYFSHVGVVFYFDEQKGELWTADGNGGSYAYLGSKKEAFDKIKSMFPNGPSSDEVAKRQAYDQRPGSPGNVVYIHKFYVHNYGTDDMYIQDWANKTYNTVDFIIRLK